MEGELGMRIWGGLFQPAMYDMRTEVDSDNRYVSAMSWKGGKNSSSLTAGPEAGIEISWGILHDVRLLLAGEMRGVSNRGSFTGTGGNSGGNASLDLLLSSYGGETGIACLLGEYGEKYRVSLTARAGVHMLSGSSQSWSENGPAGKYSWTSRITGAATGALIGLEWDMFFSDRDGSIAPGLFMLAGYRFLSFERMDYRFHDSNGVKGDGAVRNPSGDRVGADMSGPELRLGLQLAIPTKLR